MPQKSSREYMTELYDLGISGLGTGKRANKIFDILADRGFAPDEVAHSVEYGDLSLPEKWKTGGSVKRNAGGLVKRNTGGLVRPKGYGKARYKGNY